MTEEMPPATSTPSARRKWPLILGLAVVAAVAVGWFVLADGKPKDAHDVAERAAASMADEAPSDLGDYFCAHEAPTDQRAEDVVYDPGEYELGREKRLADDISFFQVISTTNPDTRYAVYALKQNDTWCLAALAVCSRGANGGYLVTSPLYCHEAYPEIPLN